MATAAPTNELIVRDPESGRALKIRGAGALKGKLRLNKAIDLTKPIAAQVLKTSRKRKSTKATG